MSYFEVDVVYETESGRVMFGVPRMWAKFMLNLTFPPASLNFRTFSDLFKQQITGWSWPLQRRFGAICFTTRPVGSHRPGKRVGSVPVKLAFGLGEKKDEGSAFL